jgi:hypothetical protein
VNEGSELVLAINATDADLPADVLTYELLSAPPGRDLQRRNARVPLDAQGPGDFTTTFRVTDRNPDAVNEQQLSAEGTLHITVNEVNLPPVLVPPTNRTIHAGVVLSTVAAAADPDLPANTLTYAKVSGPEGVNVSATGSIIWSTSDADAATTNVIVVRVTDNGIPNLSATNSFVVTVEGPPRLTSIRKEGSVATAVWDAIPGSSYRLLYNTNLTDATWSDLAGNVTASGNSASMEDSSPDRRGSTA